MADNANTPQVQKPDPIDWKTYNAGGFVPMPPPGPGYSLKVTKVDFGANPAAAPTRNKDGYLQATVDFEVVAPGQPYDGAKVLYSRFSTKKWANRNGNPMGDLLKSVGSQAQPQTDQDYVKALGAIVNQVAKASLKWEIYSQEHSLNLSSTKPDQFALFEKNEQGVTQPFVYVGEAGADGKREKVYANTKVGFFAAKK